MTVDHGGGTAIVLHAWRRREGFPKTCFNCGSCQEWNLEYPGPQWVVVVHSRRDGRYDEDPAMLSSCCHVQGNCERLESRCLHQGEISQSLFWPPSTHLEWCLPTERGIDMDIFLLDAGARKDLYANVVLTGATTSF